MTKEEILEKLEEIQNNNDGVIGQNEYDLFVREDIANFIIQQTTEKNSEIERLKAELNELKEKHKRDVIEAYEIAYNHVGDVMMGFKKITGEQYYKQKFESND